MYASSCEIKYFSKADIKIITPQFCFLLLFSSMSSNFLFLISIYIRLLNFMLCFLILLISFLLFSFSSSLPHPPPSSPSLPPPPLPGLPIPTVDIRILVTLPTEDWSQVAANSYRVTDTSVIAVLRTRELPTSSTVKYL